MLGNTLSPSQEYQSVLRDGGEDILEKLHEEDAETHPTHADPGTAEHHICNHNFIEMNINDRVCITGNIWAEVDDEHGRCSAKNHQNYARNFHPQCIAFPILHLNTPPGTLILKNGRVKFVFFVVVQKRLVWDEAPHN